MQAASCLTLGLLGMNIRHASKLVRLSAPATPSVCLRHLASSASPDQSETSTSELDVVDWDPPQYKRSGSIQSRYTVERKPIFAVVEVGAAQYKVQPDDLIFSEKLKGVTVNDKLSLMRVLMVGTETETILGRPFIPQASVSAAVEVEAPPQLVPHLVTTCVKESCSALCQVPRDCDWLAGANSGCQGNHLSQAAAKELQEHQGPSTGTLGPHALSVMVQLPCDAA